MFCNFGYSSSFAGLNNISLLLLITLNELWICSPISYSFTQLVGTKHCITRPVVLEMQFSCHHRLSYQSPSSQSHWLLKSGNPSAIVKLSERLHTCSLVQPVIFQWEPFLQNLYYSMHLYLSSALQQIKLKKQLRALPVKISVALQCKEKSQPGHLSKKNNYILTK